MKPRIIARLDCKNGDVVKGIRMEGLRRLGPTNDFARRYYYGGADELLLLDVVASLYDRAPDFVAIERALAGVYVPVTVGGGIRSLEHIRDVLRAGADRVAINTAAVREPEFLRHAADAFGVSTLVLQLDAKRGATGHEVFTHGGRERHAIDATTWVANCAPHVSEVLVTAIERDGTRTGPDLDLLRAITAAAPGKHVIAGGGIATPEHAASALRHCDAVALGTALHARDTRINALKFELHCMGIRCRFDGVDGARLEAMRDGVLRERAREIGAAA